MIKIKAPKKPKYPRNAPTLLVDIFVDPCASMNETYEEEVARQTEYYTEIFADMGVRTKFHEAKNPAQIRDNADLVLFDYGGMMMGCHDLCISHARHMIKWAEDHPNSVVLIISSFFWGNCIKYELEDAEFTGRNIALADYYSDTEGIPDWFLEAHKCKKSA